MKSEATTVEQYILNLPDDRKVAISKLREVIRKNLPKGFSEEVSYGMIGYVVPLSIYPQGYLKNKQQPLPYMNIASQKEYIAIYHMAIYADKELMDWFKKEFQNVYGGKLDIGKSCIRFKNMEQIPYKLIGELSAKMSVKEWIKKYEEEREKK